MDTTDDTSTCFICLEQEPDSKLWFECKPQRLHVPCTVRILNSEPAPRNPCTNVPFSIAEITAIEKKAKACKIECLQLADRKWLFHYQKQLKDLQDLVIALEIPLSESLFTNMSQEIQDYVYLVANPDLYPVHVPRYQKEVFLVERFKKFEKKILAGVRKHTVPRNNQEIFISLLQQYF